jgi:hypothetical protein
LTAEPKLRTAYRYAGESEWCRLGAIDKVDNVVRLCRGVPHASLLDEIVTNRSRATYEFHGDRLSGVKHWIKELALRALPALATSLWKYRGALLCRSAPLPG